MTIGLTPTGFQTQLLAEWLAALNADQLANIDPNLNQQPDSVLQMINGIVAERLATLSDVLLAVYTNSFEGASGIYLDRVCALTGITRLAATASTVVLTLTGTPGTVIPAGRVVSAPATNTKWALDSSATIGGGGTVSAPATCTVTGPTNANGGTITRIDAPVSGWTGVTNPLDAVPGRDIETDAALRARRRKTLTPNSLGPIGAVLTPLLKLAGVTSANVYHNPTNATDANGVPPHSVEAIVEGGGSAQIAAAIYGTVALGIGTYGNQSPVTITDTQGFAQVIRFSRPVSTEIKATVVLDIDPTLYAGDTAAKQALEAFVNALLPGQTVVVSKLAAMLNALPGVTDVPMLQVARLADTLGVANLHFTPREVANLQFVNITLTSSQAAP